MILTIIVLWNNHYYLNFNAGLSDNSKKIKMLIQQQWPGQGHSNEWDAMKCMHNNDYLCICLLLFIVIFHGCLSVKLV